MRVLTSFFFSCLLLSSFLSATPALATPPARPNIIFITGDDHPWPVYGFMKAIEDSGTFPTPTQHPSLPPIETPNLDRLAQRGAVFPVGAAGDSVCRPSFRATLTGLYPKDFGPKGAEEVTMGTYLANAGYIGYGYGKILATGLRTPWVYRGRRAEQEASPPYHGAAVAVH